ncbi:MAG: CoA transferase [Lysinibacillus sp.]
MKKSLKLLQHVKVLEISRSLACSYAGRLLASENANVLKLFDGEIDPFCDERKSVAKFTELLLEEALQEHWDIILYDQLLPPQWINTVKQLTKKSIIVEVTFAETIDYPTEEALQATAGWIHLTGCPQRKGLKIGGYPASFLCGAHIVFIALAGLLERNWQGHGRFIKVDSHVILLHALEGASEKLQQTGQIAKRVGNRHRALVPMCIMPSANGYVFIGAPVNEQWELLASWAEIENKWPTEHLRKAHVHELEQQLYEWTRTQQTEDLVGIGQAFRLPFSKVQTIEQVHECPQLYARDFWQENGYIANRNAWYTTFIKTNKKENATKKSRWSDLSIVDLTAMWAGPYCTRLLADLGVNVVKIEAPHRPDGIRGNQGAEALFFKELNRNKKSVSLDIRKEEDRKKLLALIKKSDIIVENFSPRVMRNFHLQAEQLAAVNENMIFASLSAFGQTGPYKDYVGYGPTIEAVSGIASQTTYDGKPWLPGFSISDMAAGVHGAVSIISSLIYKQRNEGFLRLDISQYEVAVHMLGRNLYKASSNDENEHILNINTLQQAIALRSSSTLFYESEGWRERHEPAPNLGEHNALLLVTEGEL